MNRLKEFISTYRKELYAILLVILVTAVTVGALSYFSRPANTASNNGSAVYTPPEFMKARSRAGDAAEEIVSLIKTSRKDLGLISEADRVGDYSTGLKLVVKEIKRNSNIRNAATALSEELGNMLKNINDVRPEQATRVGLQAITTGSELVQRLVNYNNYTYDLLELIKSRLSGDRSQTKSDKIKKTIEDMNTEADTINSLSDEYRGLITKFDNLVGQNN